MKAFNLKTLLLIICISFQGCLLFGGKEHSTPEVPDACEGVYNTFVTQDKDGIGVDSQRCADSQRGEWIDGGCYCRGE